MLKTCRSLKSSDEAEIFRIARALCALGVAIGIESRSVRSTIWAIWFWSGLGKFSLRIRNIIVVSARATSVWICQTWHCPIATTPIMLWQWLCVWWWKTGCPTARHVGISGGTIGSLCLTPRFRTGLSAGEKKAEQHVRSTYLDAALDSFTGYIAADELYDGPFCVLSIVDNRTFRRLTYEVLDHDPNHTDIERFFRTFQAAIQKRKLVLHGITTDGSKLYPEPISKVFGNVPHQLCEFHVIKELTKDVLRACAKVRRELAATKPKLGRGRPSSAAARKAAKQAKRIERKVGDLFQHRYLFVRHDLTLAQRRTLMRITRGRPELRTLREIMEEVYRLFDRRCRTDTALAKLARLRCRVRRFKWIGKTLQKLFSPNLEKALTFLDDKLLPSTSNAVERGNRRHRKMQKTVYSVRTKSHISARIALDMEREERSQQRKQTTVTLHKSRAKRKAA